MVQSSQSFTWAEIFNPSDNFNGRSWLIARVRLCSCKACRRKIFKSKLITSFGLFWIVVTSNNCIGLCFPLMTLIRADKIGLLKLEISDRGCTVVLVRMDIDPESDVFDFIREFLFFSDWFRIDSTSCSCVRRPFIVVSSLNLSRNLRRFFKYFKVPPMFITSTITISRETKSLQDLLVFTLPGLILEKLPTRNTSKFERKFECPSRQRIIEWQKRLDASYNMLIEKKEMSWISKSF